MDELDNIEAEFVLDQDATAEISLEELIQNKVSAVSRNLNNFITNCHMITELNDPNATLLNTSEKKMYKLNQIHIEEFFTLIDACCKDRRLLFFNEIQSTQYSGLALTFSLEQTSSLQIITRKHIETLITRIARILDETVDFTSIAHYDTYRFHCFVTRLNKISLDGQVFKDEFTLIIPEIKLTQPVKNYIANRIIKDRILQACFRDLPSFPTISDLPTQPHPIYGAARSPAHQTQYLDIIYDVTVDHVSQSVEKTIVVFDKPHNLSYELSLIFTLDAINGVPTLLRKQQFDHKPEIQVEDAQELVIAQREDHLIANLITNNTDATYIKKLLEILDESYLLIDEKYKGVIAAIAQCNTNYKPLAVWFTKGTRTQAVIDAIWDNPPTAEPITRRSLIFWAKECSPQRYNEIHKENYALMLARVTYDNEGRVEHAMASKVMAAMIADKFVVDVGQSTTTGKSGYCWYEFVTPGQKMRHGEIYKWRQEFEPDNIHLFISTHLPKIYSEQCIRIKERKEAAQSEAEQKYWGSVEKTFKLYMSKLGNDVFQKGIVKQAQYMFRHRGFYEELDSYPDIIGVGNGVLKIGVHPKLIRGFHEYKISKFTDTDYIPYNPDSPYVKDILQMVRDIYPEFDVFEFILFHSCTALDAKDAACILLLLTGGGRNGKTTLAKLIHQTLGNMYAGSGKPALLTAPTEKAESANSAQMQMVDKRYFYFDEFNKTDELNTARVKSICNPGWQSGRDLHAKQRNFRNTCNPSCFSNFDFIITTSDHGTWRRIYYYKNKIKFCEKPNPDNQYEKLVNPAIIDDWPNDPNYKQAMLSILVHYYERLCVEYKGDLKNVPVPTIMRETEAFRNRQDSLNRFITEMVVVSPACEPITITTLATKYTEWYMRVINRHANLSLNDVQTQLENCRIASYLEARYNAKYLIGHRVKASIEEPLLDGEHSLGMAIPVPKQIEVAEPIKLQDDDVKLDI